MHTLMIIFFAPMVLALGFFTLELLLDYWYIFALVIFVLLLLIIA